MSRLTRLLIDKETFELLDQLKKEHNFKYVKDMITHAAEYYCKADPCKNCPRCGHEYPIVID